MLCFNPVEETDNLLLATGIQAKRQGALTFPMNVLEQ
jgi:hypothetical protein